ncbi:hypothetical protein [Nocardioides sp.]
MSSYFTEAVEVARRQELAERARRPVPGPRPRTRTRVAAVLRHTADRLDN